MTSRFTALRQIPDLEVARGTTAGVSVVHKFGEGGDIDAGDGYVDIWDGAVDVNAAKTYTFSTTADIDRISSSNDGDTQDIEVQGLDANWELTIQTKTLTGQTPVALDTALIRVFRMKNMGTTDLVGDCYCFVNGDTTGGIPDTNADIRAIINDGNNQTLMAIYTIPAGKTGYLYQWWASADRAVATVYNVHIQARPFGGVFQLKNSASLNSAGTGYIIHPHKIPDGYAEKTDIKIQSDSSANNGGIAGGFEIVLVDH